MSVCLYVVGLLVFWVLFGRLPVCLDSEVLCLSVRLFGLWVCWFWISVIGQSILLLYRCDVFLALFIYTFQVVNGLTISYTSGHVTSECSNS